MKVELTPSVVAEAGRPARMLRAHSILYVLRS
jgi:hypothetical protein